MKYVGSVVCLFLHNEHISKVFKGHSTQLKCYRVNLFSAQVDRLEVVNKQFVRVILVPGADSSEGVSSSHLLCSSSYLCGMALMCCCLPSELRVV